MWQPSASPLYMALNWSPISRLCVSDPDVQFLKDTNTVLRQNSSMISINPVKGLKTQNLSPKEYSNKGLKRFENTFPGLSRGHAHTDRQPDGQPGSQSDGRTNRQSGRQTQTDGRTQAATIPAWLSRPRAKIRNNKTQTPRIPNTKSDVQVTHRSLFMILLLRNINNYGANIRRHQRKRYVRKVIQNSFRGS